MSYTSIPNQPIIFHTEEEIQTPCIECGDGSYRQLVDLNDQLFFQVESTPCSISSCYKYDSFLGVWQDIDNKICSVGDAGVYAVYLRTQYIFQLYQVTFTILTFDEGVLNVSVDGSSTYQITLAGTYTLYFANPTMTNDSITLRFYTNTGEVGWKGCLSQYILVDGLPSINQMKVGIVDATTLETIDLITPIYTLKDNKITTAFDLTNVAVSEGCYRISMTDFCSNTCGQSYLVNGVFRSLPRIGVDGWAYITEFDAVVTLSEGSAYFDLPYEDSTAYLINSVSACTGKYYYVSIFVESRSNANISVQIGDEFVYFGAGTGYLTAAITAGNPSTNGTQVTIIVQDNGVGTGYANIKLVEISIDNNDVQWDMYSDILTIGDYNDSCKYFKIEGCNAQDQFNLAFGGSSFLPMIRLEGRRSKAQYVTNANTFRYASGKWNANYVNRLKQWTYHFGRLPEYVLDFLSTIFYYDNCYVNGVLMFPQDNAFPTIDWSDADTYLGSFNIDLLEKENKVVKVQCTDSDADCLPSILDNQDEPFILTQDLNRITTQDSINLYQEN